MSVNAQLQDVVDIIQKEFDAVYYELKNRDDTEEAMSRITAIKVSNSQAFKSLEDEVIRKNRGTIWVVVSFQSGSANFGANSYPITLNIFGFPNSINPTQVVLTEFVKRWTTRTLGEGLTGISSDYDSSVQIWNTPNIFSNFNEVADHFRSTFSVSGVIVLGTNTVKLSSIKYIYDPTAYASDPTTGWEQVDFMQFNSDYRASPNPQPFGNTNGFSITEVNFSTDTFSISTYLLNTQLVADVLAVKGYTQTSSGTGIKTSTKKPNDKCVFIFTYTNGFSNATSNAMFKEWKLVSFGIDQPLGSITRMTVVFTH